MKRCGMKQQTRLARNEDFRRVRREGRSWSAPLLVLQTFGNNLPHSRLGLVVSKRVGTAVVRNRVRRRLREAARDRWPSIKPGWDVVLIARVPAAGADFWQLSSAMDTLFERAGLFGREHTPNKQSTTK